MDISDGKNSVFGGIAVMGAAGYFQQRYLVFRGFFWNFSKPDNSSLVGSFKVTNC